MLSDTTFNNALKCRWEGLRKTSLKTATINPCLYFELERKGNIKESYIADLILLTKNPLLNIRNTLSIDKVIKNGKIVVDNN